MKITNSLLFIFFISTLTVFGQIETNSETFFKKGNSLKLTLPDSSIVYYKKSFEISILKKDTTKAVKSIIALADIYAHNIDYNKAYDEYWNALLLSEKINNRVLTSRIYHKLGFLYSFFKRDKKALEYFNISLKTDKELYKLKIIKLGYILSDYYSFTNFYRSKGNYELANKYLDSCLIIQNLKSPNEKNYYIEAEQGFLLSQEKKYDEAFEILNETRNHFKKNSHPYIVIVDNLIGQIHMQMGNFDKSEAAFLKSLQTSEKQKSHLNYKVMNYDALSELYYNNKQFKKAFNYIQLSKKLNEDLYGSNSESNKALFNIKDNYRLTKENQEKIKKKHRIKQLEQQENISFLKQIILIVSLFSVIIFGYLFIKRLRYSHKSEKKLIKQQQNDTLELKNKELASSTLQLIEKEEFLENLRQKLDSKTEKLNLRTIKTMVQTSQVNSSANWKEFETRFTRINQSFYKNLLKNFPDLGTTDQKICSLIKLKLSSKQMASLLGISVESVYTSRYRLRKKLELDRDDNLIEFINSL